MLAMLVVQLAAQWCAWHCGAVDLLERTPFSSLGDAAATRHVEAVVSAGSAGPALAAAASTFDVAPGDTSARCGAPGDTSARCGAQAWCELGQTPPLESSAPPVLAHAASAPDPAPSAPVAAFLSSPEERPPAA